jgi:aminopeptidase
MSATSEAEYVRRLAELAVRFGANVQPGQIVALSSEPGKEELARAVAQAAYQHGALFVDLRVFDLYLKRARALYADPDTLGFVPEWYGQQTLAYGKSRCARIGLTGPVDPHVMDGVDPELLGRDPLPRVKEASTVLNERTTNWCLIPCPTRGWATLVHPDLDPDAAVQRLWQEIAHVCRLEEPDPVQAWSTRIEHLLGVCGKLGALRLDRLHFSGPGTDLTVGLMDSSRWIAARLSTIDGIEHVPNLPTEEVFTTPDPQRTEGVVTSTKPLQLSGSTITGLRVRFEAGRAVEIGADEGAGALRALADQDEGGRRLGEVALVDRESRIGQLGTIFYDTLLDENAASHIALGQGLAFAVDGDAARGRINQSTIHVDFMIGSDEVSVTGVAADGREFELLRGGEWQL